MLHLVLRSGGGERNRAERAIAVHRDALADGDLLGTAISRASLPPELSPTTNGAAADAGAGPLVEADGAAVDRRRAGVEVRLAAAHFERAVADLGEAIRRGADLAVQHERAAIDANRRVGPQRDLRRAVAPRGVVAQHVQSADIGCRSRSRCRRSRHH